MVEYVSEYQFKIFKKSFALCCIDVIILNKKNEFLLVKRNISPYKRKWCLPGGIIHYGERMEKAVIRIIKEELGVSIKLIDNIGFFEKIYSTRHDVSHCFIARQLSDTIQLDFQATDAKFFSRIPANTPSFHKEMIKKFRKKSNSALRFHSKRGGKQKK